MKGGGGVGWRRCTIEGEWTPMGRKYTRVIGIQGGGTHRGLWDERSGGGGGRHM